MLFRSSYIEGHLFSRLASQTVEFQREMEAELGAIPVHAPLGLEGRLSLNFSRTCSDDGGFSGQEFSRELCNQVHEHLLRFYFASKEFCDLVEGAPHDHPMVGSAAGDWEVFPSDPDLTTQNECSLENAMGWLESIEPFVADVNGIEFGELRDAIADVVFCSGGPGNQIAESILEAIGYRRGTRATLYTVVVELVSRPPDFFG